MSSTEILERQKRPSHVISGGRESGNLGAYLERNPLYKNQFNLGATIEFRVPGTQYLAIGYEATLLGSFVLQTA